MSHRSEVAVWRADQPHSRQKVALEAIQATASHYYRLIRMTLTGKDCLK